MVAKEKQKTADELVEEGQCLHKQGHFVVVLYPSQEWMAVKVQMPFFRCRPIPTGDQNGTV